MLRLPKALRFYNQPKQQWNKLFVRSFVTLRRDERVSLPDRGPAGFAPAGSDATGAATGAPLAPAGRVPSTQAASGGTQWRAGGHGWERAPSSPGQGSGGQAAVLLRGVPRRRWAPFARGGKRECLCQEPDRRDERDFSGWYLGSPGREDPTSPASAYCARCFFPGAPGVPGGARRSPPETAGRRSCALPDLGVLFDLMCCLGRALTEVVLVSEIGVFVSCSPHTFLTTVITKLIAGPKTDVKTSLKCLSVNNWEGGKTHYLIV